jgi:hypothetical protein
MNAALSFPDLADSCSPRAALSRRLSSARIMTRTSPIRPGPQRGFFCKDSADSRMDGDNCPLTQKCLPAPGFVEASHRLRNSGISLCPGKLFRTANGLKSIEICCSCCISEPPETMSANLPNILPSPSIHPSLSWLIIGSSLIKAISLLTTTVLRFSFKGLTDTGQITNNPGLRQFRVEWHPLIVWINRQAVIPSLLPLSKHNGQLGQEVSKQPPQADPDTLGS